MAHILRGYGLAREQGYFKTEQEADVQRHRQRLIREGKLPPEPEPGTEPAGEGRQRGQGFAASEAEYETLAEVLQQRARVDDPHALRRKEYERRVKGEAPPLSEAELLRARSTLGVLGAAVGHVPGRVSLGGRNRWAVPQAPGGEAALRQLSPEVQEVAARTYMAGVRALVYGSLLGALAVAGAATYAIRAADIRSGADFGDRMRQGLEPLSASLKGWLVPLKESAQAWLGPKATANAAAGDEGGGGDALLAPAGGVGSGTGAAGAGVTAEFSRRLQQRLNTGKGGGGSGGPDV